LKRMFRGDFEGDDGLQQEQIWKDSVEMFFLGLESNDLTRWSISNRRTSSILFLNSVDLRSIPSEKFAVTCVNSLFPINVVIEFRLNLTRKPLEMQGDRGNIPFTSDHFPEKLASCSELSFFV
jgi:hypothetical protein